MPKLPEMRTGTELKAYDRLVPFSFWPTGQGHPRPPVQSLLFALDPWIIMRRALIEQMPSGSSLDEATAYISQAKEYFQSALSSSIDAAKPLQLYYCYLNIAKAFVMARGLHPSLSSLMHGLNENVGPAGDYYQDAFVRMWPSPNRQGQLQAFDEFMVALGQPGTNPARAIPLPHLVPQILPGHRLWSAAANQKERFIALHSIKFIENKRNQKSWIRLYLYQDDVKRLGYTQENVLTMSGLSGSFRKVKCSETDAGRTLICLEQRVPLDFNRHAVDTTLTLAESVRTHLWVTVSSIPPYRRYYLYLSPPNESGAVVSQLGSIYALTFYLGSVTRYRPNEFQALLRGDFGARLEEFVTGQPLQFIYLMASEFAKRDVTKPSIV